MNTLYPVAKEQGAPQPRHRAPQNFATTSMLLVCKCRNLDEESPLNTSCGELEKRFHQRRGIKLMPVASALETMLLNASNVLTV